MCPDDTSELKTRIRERVWREMESGNIAIFPLPAAGRVPNFRGSAEAAARLRALEEYRAASVVMVNPDAAQLPVRRLALSDGKRVLMATPGLRRGFMMVDPARLRDIGRAATIAGAFKSGKVPDLRDLKVDLVVEGSVAVDVHGGRTGKGSGWGDLEYAILRESGAIDDSVRVVTTVHDVQVVDGRIPMEPHDMPVDTVLTPTRTIATARAHPRPCGVIWERLSAEKRELLRRIVGAQM